jgi:hypothetical protein
MKSVFIVALISTVGLAQAPTNDTCQQSIALPGTGTYPGTTVGSTLSIFGTGTCGLTGNDVWYTYVATGTGNELVASTCPPGSSTFSSGVDIFTGTCFTPTTSICSTTWCNHTPTVTGARAVTTTIAGTLYRIRVKGLVNGQTGTFSLYVDEKPATQPNGVCTTATAVIDGVNANRSNFGEPAALAPGFAPCAAAGKDVFFSYVATYSGGTVVRTCLPSAAAVPALNIRDSVIAVYANCAGGAPLACNDNGCGGAAGTGANLSSLTFPSVAGASYVIQVAGAGSGAAAAEGWFDLEIVPPPPNDECSGAIPIAPGSNGPFTNLLATDSAGYSGTCATGHKDLFYAFTAPFGAPVTVNTGCNGFNTVLSVWTACGGTEIVCNDDSAGCGQSSSTTFEATAGQSFIIRAASATPGTSGSFNVNVVMGTPYPANDECSGAVPLAVGSNGPFSNQSSSTSPGYSTPCGWTGYHDLFFSYTAACGSNVTVSVSCGAFNKYVTVTRGCAGEQIVCTPNTCGPGVVFGTAPGETYVIRVGGHGPGDVGSFTVDVALGAPYGATGPIWESAAGGCYAPCYFPDNFPYYAPFVQGPHPFSGLDLNHSWDGLTVYSSTRGCCGAAQNDFKSITQITRPSRSSPWNPAGFSIIPELADPTLCRKGARTTADNLEMFFVETNVARFDIAGSPGFGLPGATPPWYYKIRRATRSTVTSPWTIPTYPADTVYSYSAGTGALPQLTGYPAPEDFAFSFPLSITADGLELYFCLWAGTCPIGGPANGNRVYHVSRSAVGQPFGPPVADAVTTGLNNNNCAPVPFAGSINGVLVSGDGLTLVFSWNLDYYVRMLRRPTRSTPWVSVTPAETMTGVVSGGVQGATGDWNEAFLRSTSDGGNWVYSFNGLIAMDRPGTSVPMSLAYRPSPRITSTPYIGACALGSSPGTPLGARTFPLNYDWLLLASLGGFPGLTTGFSGLLDVQGGALATLGPVPAGLTGATFVVAFATLDPCAPDGVGNISNWIPLEVGP